MTLDDAAVRASRALGKRDDMVVHGIEPYNAEPPRSALAAAQLTPVDAFYVRNHGPVPAARAAMSLRIEGLVARPQDLSVTELRE